MSTTQSSQKTTASSPRWNLDSIFPSLESESYKKALADYTSLMDKIDTLLAEPSPARESFDFPEWLSRYLTEDEKLTALSATLNAYAYIVYSTDTTNNANLNNISRIEEMGLRAQSQELRFRSILKANEAYLSSFYERFPAFAEWKFLIDETLADCAHQMSDAEENLASDLQRTGGDAWDRLHEQIISNLTDRETGKTFNELRNDAYSPDAAVRRSSWEKEISLLRANEIAFAACLNNLKGETVTLNKRRNWAEAIDRSLASSRMGRKTLDALIGSIEESLPVWRTYFKAKAAYLRGQGQTVSNAAAGEGLAFYDLFAPLSATGTGTTTAATSNTPAPTTSPACPSPDSSINPDSLLSRTWTFEEARDYVLERYYSFSADMGDFARYAFDHNWIDAEVRSGKVGGAYDEDFALGHQSRILTNFTGAFSDIITLAHELGHAYHFHCMKGKPAAFFSYPMTLAETASTFAETITKQDMIARAASEDRLQILELDLQDASQVLIDILCRFYFERSVFEERKNAELTAADFCRLMKEAQEKSYGEGLSSERHEYMWAVKSHYYSTGLDFYNFPYAFGQLFAAGLYELYKKEGTSFAKTYSELLSHTGNMSCEDLCRRCGFDITTKEFWKSGIALYEREVEEFAKCVNFRKS